MQPLSELIRVLLIDDHSLFRRGLKFLLSQEYGFEVVAEAADGLEGVKLVHKLNPDIVLLDLDMPLMNGVETLEQILNHQPDLPVLILTISENSTHLQKCLSLGARGYILKNADINFLVTAIKSALVGQRTISEQMLQNDYDIEIDTKLATLTSREQEVLDCLSQGMSNKLIADKMCVSENTVKVHVQNILRKLNLKSRLQAAIYK